MMLDLTEKIELPDEIKAKFCNELTTLANIWRGMCLIYQWAYKIEQKANEGIKAGDGFKTMPLEVRKAFENKDVRYFSAFNDPAFAWVDKGLLYSLFQWYAVSACNYVRLVGYLAKESGSSKQEALAYVDRIASVIYQVVFDNRRFYAPIWQVTIGRKGQQVRGTNPGSWSITETHEKLIKRYKNEK